MGTEKGEPEGFSTSAIHAGEQVDPETGSVSTPIYQTATFGFDKTDQVVDSVNGTSGRELYTRWGNPTVSVLEKKLARLEETEDSVAFSSGMAAITSTFLSFVSKGDHLIVQRSLYGEAFNFVSNYLPRFGVDVSVIETGDYDALEKQMRPNTKFVYLETPTNPTIKIVDLDRAARIVDGRAITAVDSTFGTPYNQRPVSLGMDLVVHSATKYLNGHSDVIAGIVAGRKELTHKIRMTRRVFGGTMAPLAAWLVIRGMKTFALRMKKHNENAIALANFLKTHPLVTKVNYPALPDNPFHEVARKQMPSGCGGVLSFEVKGSIEDARKVVENLNYAILGASLGGVETLVTQPATTSHHQLSREEREKAEITDTLIRVAVGVEDTEDLIRDFDNALGVVSSSRPVRVATAR